MKQTLTPRRLSFEQLEDRLTPVAGVPWFDGTSLSLSFVPDGTNTSGVASNLTSLLASTTGVTAGKKEILRAYQTWTAQTNLNIGVIGDGGQAMGTVGPPQEDVRFGDIRVAARSLSGVTGDNPVAVAVPFDYNTKTWAGDLLLNNQFLYGIGVPAGQGYDLFSVALHEAGHSLGLADNDLDPTSVMFGSYQPRTGPSVTDVLNLQALYGGARKADAYEGTLGNGTTLTAHDLTANGNRTAVSADVTSLADADYYKFTTPLSSTGVTGLTVNLQASGVSMLTAKVTVLNASGAAVATASTLDPLNNNLSVTIPNYQANAAYYVKVEGASGDVFSIGAYVLKLNYAPTNPAGTNSTITNSYYTNLELGSNETQATAATLTPARSTKANSFLLLGSVSSTSDADWYKITPTAPVGYTGTLFVGAIGSTGGLRPMVSVYNSAGVILPSEVIMDEQTSFTVQLPNATTGTTYYVRVAGSTLGSQPTGIYTLGATLAPVSAVSFAGAATGTLTGVAGTNSGTAVSYATMTVPVGRVAQFALGATGGSATVTTGVRVTVFDSTGRSVFTAVAKTGQPLATGALWLASGTYTVAFNAATSDWSPVAGVAYSLSTRALSDPIDPYVEDPTSPPPPPDDPIAVSPPIPPPPPTTIIDPVTDPFARVLTMFPPPPP